MGRILAVDLGKKRTGLALSDPLRLIASPFMTINFTNESDLIAQLMGIIEDKDVDKIIIGLPIKENGTEGEGCEWTRKIGRLLEERRYDVVLWDERYSSRMAEQVIRQHGIKPKNVRGAVDEIAASFILESYMRCHKYE